MATVTTKYKSGSRSQKIVYTSAWATGADDLVDLSDLDEAYPHCFLSVELLDGSGDPIGAGVATGTFTVAVYTENNPNMPEDPVTASLDAALLVTSNWQANTQRVTVQAASLTGVTSWRVILSTNRS